VITFAPEWLLHLPSRWLEAGRPVARIRQTAGSPKEIMRKLTYTVFACGLLLSCCIAQTAAPKVLPWNGHVAAVSLTFDDARPVQLDIAIPELNKRQLRATFFVPVSKLTRIDDWRKAAAEGHEIGNHSVSHEHPANLTKEGEETQVEEAKYFLDSNFHSPVITFAYPYMEISPGLLFWVKKYNFAARGWPENPDLLYVTSQREPDWYNLPGQPAFTNYDNSVYQGWINKAISLHAWTTLQFHGIGDASTGWEPIPLKTFLNVLDYVKEQKRELWVAPFGEVAAYLRAQKILEAAQPELSNGAKRFTWRVPKPFPAGVVLKVTVDGSSVVHLYQGGRKLPASKQGFYSVSFDSRELLLRGGS
jgi:peptidoglycan/xylan/chitin deacetylase (PgdA/CDA1 family)